jgi:hypothetical protein
VPAFQLCDPGCGTSVGWKAKRRPHAVGRGYNSTSQWEFYRKRAAHIVRMRSEGSTYREISECCGVSVSRCREIFITEEIRGRWTAAASRPCSLCASLPGAPHIRLGPCWRGRPVPANDLGHGVWLP